MPHSRIHFWKVPLMALALCLCIASAAQARPDPIAFAREKFNDAIAKLTDPKLSDQQRFERMAQVLDSSFDVDAVSRFVLGPHAQKATEKQFAEFKRLYRVYVAYNYAGLFKRYEDVNVNMKEAVRLDNGDAVVSGTIKPANNQPVEVKVQLRPKGDTYRAVNMHVEGVSMPLTHRKQFSSVIERHGGKVEGLLNELEKLLAKLKNG